MQLSVNGIDTFVATGGREFDSSLPTIVLLHGAGFDHTAWALSRTLVLPGAGHMMMTERQDNLVAALER